jgi:hypothetical protein
MHTITLKISSENFAQSTDSSSVFIHIPYDFCV